LSVFYVYRRNVLFNDSDSGFNFLTNTGTELSGRVNGGNATSQGVDLSGLLAAFRGITLTGNFDYTQAVLTTAIPQQPGTPEFITGYQLPNVPRFSGNLAAEYAWTLASGWAARVAGSDRWVGKQWGSTSAVQSLAGGAPSAELPSYELLNLDSSLSKGEIAFKAFVSNVANKRAFLGSGITQNFNGAPLQINYALAQPRTAGLGVDFKF
jgi:iron complex outermembrane recepter protein